MGAKGGHAATIKSPEIAKGIASSLKAGLLPKIEHEGKIYHALEIHKIKKGEAWTVLLEQFWST